MGIWSPLRVWRTLWNKIVVMVSHVNGLKSSEAYLLQKLKWFNLCYVNFTIIKKKQLNPKGNSREPK